METELVRYIYIGLSVVCAWIIFSAFVLAIICMNASRLSRGQEPFFDRVAWIKYRLEQEEK